MDVLLTIIVPAAKGECHEAARSLKAFEKNTEIELIFIPKEMGRSRASRLNLGIQKSRGKMILLHHPRSIVDVSGIQHLLTIVDSIVWGAFQHRFDHEHPLLKWTSWYSNSVRGRLKGIYYLDHCIFFHKSLLDSPIKDVEIFEDTFLSLRLKSKVDPLRLPFFSTTSSVRFQKNGVYKQALMNQILKLGFYMGLSPSLMNKIYERGLNLN